MCVYVCVCMYNRNYFNSRSFTVVMCDHLTVLKLLLTPLKLILKLSIIFKIIMKNTCKNNLVNSYCLYSLR